ncbi:tyrosine-protein phosphatase Lar-like [Ditylenchus destructor]|nr:tyrosine-protein phosphatase Lar-like [Ditylenchus destructor]
MQEPASRLFTDSMLSAPFSTRSSSILTSSTGRSSNLWLLGPAIAILIVLCIVGMLVVWWLRSSKKPFRGLHAQSGSQVTKVALGNGEFNSNGGVPTETSKLLLGMDADGRPVMNAYETKHENMNLYPDTNIGHTNMILNNNPNQPLQMNGGFATIGNIHHTAQQHSTGNLMANSMHGGVAPEPIPLAQFATHIDRLKMNNNALFIQVGIGVDLNFVSDTECQARERENQK